MKTIISLVLILFSSALIGYSIKSSKSNEILLNSSWTNNFFQKKQMCLWYKEDMFNFAKWFRNEFYEIKEIFYSPIKESCYFIVKEVGKESLFDYLSQSYITSYEWCPLKTNIADCRIKQNKYIDLVKNLKWE